MRTKFALALAPVMCLAAHSAQAQSSTAVGVGISGSSSNASSRSGAVAISGQGGNGGNATSNARGGNARASNNGSGNSSLTVNGAPAVTASTNNSTITERNVPSTFAPGLTAAGLETCLGSVSGGASVVGFGGSFGTTVPDPGCAARLDARTLWSMGLKGAAVARLCLTPEIYRSMPDVCVKYMPQPPQGYVAPILLSAEKTGQIELIDGKTGMPRMCNSYDAEHQHCRAWVRTASMTAPAPALRKVATPKPRPAEHKTETAKVADPQ